VRAGVTIKEATPGRTAESIFIPGKALVSRPTRAKEMREIDGNSLE
jgi:hypothetical protein